LHKDSTCVVGSFPTNHVKSEVTPHCRVNGFVVARQAFVGVEVGDLSFAVGDRIVVTDNGHDWWFGHHVDDVRKSGSFPSNFTEAGAEEGDLRGHAHDGGCGPSGDEAALEQHATPEADATTHASGTTLRSRQPEQVDGNEQTITNDEELAAFKDATPSNFGTDMLDSSAHAGTPAADAEEGAADLHLFAHQCAEPMAHLAVACAEPTEGNAPPEEVEFDVIAPQTEHEEVSEVAPARDAAPERDSSDHQSAAISPEEAAHRKHHLTLGLAEEATEVQLRRGHAVNLHGHFPSWGLSILT
jgi:hypothetical protein